MVCPVAAGHTDNTGIIEWMLVDLVVAELDRAGGMGRRGQLGMRRLVRQADWDER